VREDGGRNTRQQAWGFQNDDDAPEEKKDDGRAAQNLPTPLVLGFSLHVMLKHARHNKELCLASTSTWQSKGGESTERDVLD